MADDYEVVIVRYGTRQGHRSEVFLNHHVTGRPDAPIGMDYYVWVIRNHERTILVDTGFSPEGGANRSRTWVKDIPSVYAALGIDPQGEHTIVVTHAHYDHIGNLGLFPNATVVIARREYDFWINGLGHRAQFAWSTEDAELAELQRAHDQGRVRTFSDTFEVAPGVTVIEIGGHTPGQSAVLVHTAEGDVLLASDAVHYYEEYEDDLPFAFVADLPAMYAGFDRIRAMLGDGVSHLVPGHDPDTLNRFRMVEEGPLAGIAATIGQSHRGGAS
ncbi:MBL fold hydrolase [Agromyces rhizosphaerae]|uniref:MBL fold hydrolase n=1 Tax=Agromyces rhizosphaerae TaxID=88374 RepID=A0A9W6CQ91_9MICO|nr:N-acyl homoserine lactonase family protein [Agromyces rhizosphaerae]GLI26533.1 MBL fold hydrolase [Agromyces rhizosphaerae]